MLIVEDHRDSAALLHSMHGLPEQYGCTRRISGLDLARAIRDRPNGGRHILVGYSGYGKEDDRQRALETGMDAYFVKPSPVEDLLDAIGFAAAKKTAHLASD